nr:MAG: ORF1 [Torque teno midi virus]
MPFWWRRRQRRWLPKRQYLARRRRWRKKRRRPYRRQRYTRPTRRRRRRRRRKVRRKKKRIAIQQWQPDSITHCKIKGVGVLILGGEGKQLACYTAVKDAWVPARAPGGGGFACQQYSLGWLYREYQFRNNIWTKTNVNKDLCRYLKTTLVFYRHQDTDFIVSYDRQPPFILDEWTYPLCHPQMLLLGKHKVIIPSKKTKKYGKNKKKITILPPKQMITKWFFQEHFTTAPLFSLRAAACNFNYAHLGCCNKSQMVNFFSLNTSFYMQGNWALHQPNNQPYKPYPTVHVPLYCFKKKGDTSEPPYATIGPDSYNDSIDYTKGYFATTLLLAKCISSNTGATHECIANMPLNSCTYNVNVDSGEKNYIWLHSCFQTQYQKPQTDKILILAGAPLWLMLHGWLSYVQQKKVAKDFFLTYIVVLQSPAIKIYSSGTTSDLVIPLDSDFVNGKAPYDEVLTDTMKSRWYPNVYNQLHILNTIVEAGPYIPKYSQDRNSTWELHYYYNFQFKWGGPEITDQPVANPADQPTYNAWDQLTAGVQVRDPQKQKFDTLLHPWDYRRGIIKNSAYKRMQDNLTTDSEFAASIEPPKKKKKVTGPLFTDPSLYKQEIKTSVLSLCEENIFQEPKTQEEMQILIKQQQLQQQQLKRDILTIISDLKEEQRLLQLQAGFLS